MQSKFSNIRTFIGAKNYEESRAFYRALGFMEVILTENMSLFKVNDQLAFYLQDYYVKAWINNSMVFMEVDDVEACWEELIATELDTQYKYVRFTPIKQFDHGRQCFMHDPSGVLWHFCEFKK